MGTWGSGPFDNDSADDLFDELAPLSGPQRMSALLGILSEVTGGPDADNNKVLPDRVMAAAAVVAANTPSGAELDWNEERPEIADWLAKPVPTETLSEAVRALEAALPPDSWYWTSWVDNEERVESTENFNTLLRVLRTP